MKKSPTEVEAFSLWKTPLRVYAAGDFIIRYSPLRRATAIAQ